MEYSKYYGSNDAVIEHPDPKPAFAAEDNAEISDTNAPDLSSRELMTRFDTIKKLYDSANTPAGKQRLRKEAHSIKHLIVEHRRKVAYSTGSLVMAIALLIILLQNIGLI